MKYIIGTKIYIEKPRISGVGMSSTQIANAMKNKKHTMGLPVGLYTINNIRKDDSGMLYTLRTDSSELIDMQFESVKTADEFIDRWVVD